MDINYFKPTKPILEPTYPVLRPEQSELDYRESKQIDFCELATPVWDKPSNSISLDWVYAKREFRHADEHLAITRKEASVQYEENNIKWEELQQKEKNLRQSFIRFEQFVVENEEKRKRARKKIAEEKLMQEQRIAMLQEALNQQSVLIDVKQKLDQKTKEYRIYEEFLNKVVMSNMQYKTINDVIKRYVVLMETKDQVSAKRAKDMDELDHAKMEYSRLLDEKSLVVMMLNSRMVELIVRHDEARTRALLWESIVTEIRDITEQKEMELISVKVSMWSLYKQMCARKAVTLECKKDNIEGQLLFIKKTLFELRKVRNIVEKIVGKNYTGIQRKKKQKKTKVDIESKARIV